MDNIFRQYIPIQLVASDCSICPPVGKGLAPVKDADIVQPEKAALKNIISFGVLTIHPPSKVQQQLVEARAQETGGPHTFAFLLDLVDAPGRPGMHGRIDISQRPFISGNLPVGMHVPFAQHEDELVLGETGIDKRERETMKGQIPGRIPGVLPFIRHGNDICIVEMRPVAISTRGVVPAEARALPDRP